MTIVENLIEDYLSINVLKDEEEWSVSGSYSNGYAVRDGNYMYKWAGEDGGNSIERPSTFDQKTFPIWIIDNPTNYYGALDDQGDTVTSKSDGDLVIEIDNPFYDTLSLLGVVGTQATVQILDKDTEEILNSEVFNLVDNSNISDEYQYFFAPFSYKTSIYTTNLNLYVNSKIKITITSASGSTISVGRLIAGYSYKLGETQLRGALSSRTYSTTTTSLFGKTTIQAGSKVNDADWSIRVRLSNAINIQKKLVELSDKPVLWIADENHESNIENGLLFGYNNLVPIPINNAVNCFLSVSIKGIL